MLHKTVSTKKDHFFLVFVLLRVAAKILEGGGRSDVTGTHVARWLSAPPPASGIGLSVSMFMNSCDPLLNSRRLNLYSKPRQRQSIIVSMLRPKVIPTSPWPFYPWASHYVTQKTGSCREPWSPMDMAHKRRIYPNFKKIDSNNFVIQGVIEMPPIF